MPAFPVPGLRLRVVFRKIGKGFEGRPEVEASQARPVATLDEGENEGVALGSGAEEVAAGGAATA